MHRSKLYVMLSERLQTALHRKKILCNVVVILLGQHCTGKTLCNVFREAPDNIAQEKNSEQCFLNTPGTTFQCCLGRWAPGNITQEKILCNVVLILLGQHCTGKTLSSVVPEAPDNIAQEKIQAMLSEQHLVTPFIYIYIYIYIYIRSFMSHKKKKISFLYYENWSTN